MSANSRVFVGSIPNEFSEEDLIKRFSVHGSVSQFNNTKKGYAFLQFENEDQAKAAVSKENNTDFMGKKINVNFAKVKKNEAERQNRPAGREGDMGGFGGRAVGPGSRDGGHGGRDGGQGGRDGSQGGRDGGQGGRDPGQGSRGRDDGERTDRDR